jgi:hypothetical protein
MKKILTLVMSVTAMSLTAQLRLPQASPSATVTQALGTVDLTLKYSRPSMKGREIFGKLLPYGKVWRTGANGATQFISTGDIMVEGQKLAAGTYSVFSIPNAGNFTVIFNKDAGASEANYSQEKDAIRVNVATQQIPTKQTFGIALEDLTDSTATMNMAWETTNVPVKLRLDLASAVNAQIERNIGDQSNNMTNAANYLLGAGKDTEKALKLADMAIGARETFRNVWVKAQLLSKLGRFAEALPLAQKALSLGQTDSSGAFGFFKDAIEKGVSEYSSKIPPVVQEVIKKKKK